MVFCPWRNYLPLSSFLGLKSVILHLRNHIPNKHTKSAYDSRQTGDSPSNFPFIVSTVLLFFYCHAGAFWAFLCAQAKWQLQFRISGSCFVVYVGVGNTVTQNSLSHSLIKAVLTEQGKNSQSFKCFTKCKQPVVFQWSFCIFLPCLDDWSCVSPFLFVCLFHYLPTNKWGRL